MDHWHGSDIRKDVRRGGSLRCSSVRVHNNSSGWRGRFFTAILGGKSGHEEVTEILDIAECLRKKLEFLAAEMQRLFETEQIQ
jgi:hypothetical protein